MQVKAYLRKERQDINHWFDVWHMAKGIYKKLQKIGKKKGLEIVSLWAHSISNHLYWCAASSKGDPEEVKAKWLSLLNHRADIHTGHSVTFPSCQHGEIEDRIWIHSGTRAHKEISSIINSRFLLQGIGKLSPQGQTSNLEGFHSVICHFAEKFYHLHFSGMNARLMLSALHYNENSTRGQSVTRDGEARWHVAYAKSRNWEAVAKAIKSNATYEYIGKLVAEVATVRTSFPSCQRANLALHSDESPNVVSTHGRKRPKEDVAKDHKKRFCME